MSSISSNNNTNCSETLQQFPINAEISIIDEEFQKRIMSIESVMEGYLKKCFAFIANFVKQQPTGALAQKNVKHDYVDLISNLNSTPEVDLEPSNLEIAYKYAKIDRMSSELIDQILDSKIFFAERRNKLLKQIHKELVEITKRINQY